MTTRLLRRSLLIIMQRLSSLSMHKTPITIHWQSNRYRMRFDTIPGIVHASIMLSNRGVRSKTIAPKLFKLVSILSLFGLNRTDEKIDSALVDTLKRAILMIQRGLYDKAEIALHLALDMAQKQEHVNGIIYTYDLMANLAFNRKEYVKAKKLFVQIMQMLLAEGTPENDPKMIHISLKLSKMYEKVHDYKLAEIGYQWCFKHLSSLKMINDDEKLLNALAHNWYAEYLLEINQLEESAVHLKTAYNIVSEVRENPNAEIMIILNDLGFLYSQLGQNVEAQKYLEKAYVIAKAGKIDEFVDVIRANLGLVCLYNGSREKALNLCIKAKTNALQSGSSDALDQAYNIIN